MIFARFYDSLLAQASYLVGCGATGEAIVIDPSRAVDQYIAAAEREGLRITRVTETHIHADFVSGTRELASRTGARMILSDAGPPDWQYAFRSEPNVDLVRDGDTFSLGRVTFQVLHTPGHTPEHISLLLTDTAVSDEPMGMFTGDFVFVGDVGRPDLLEKAAHLATESETSARMLFRSLAGLRRFPDHLQIWPGHGAGSACGKGLSAVPQSTLGYERRVNWAFGIDDESVFVSAVLEGQPEPPAYFGRMKIVNRAGPALLGSHPAPERLGVGRLREMLDTSLVVDTRPAADHAAGHVVGTISIPWNRSFVTHAGSLVPADRDCCLMLAEDNPALAEEIAGAMSLIGLDNVRGYFGGDVNRSSEARGTIPQMSVTDLAALDPTGQTILDVRGRSEWDQGHLAQALLVPLPELLARLEEIPRDRPVVVHCQGGGRSAIAASVLASRGYEARNLAGGFSAWQQAGLPVAGGRR